MNDKSKYQEDKLKALADKAKKPEIKASIEKKLLQLNTEVKK